jgi:fucose 4-O-acetylase-like acetyltransferase
MSQRGGNLSYPLFAGGFSLFVYVLFYIACDMWGWRLAFFETFGTNALLAYVLHGMVASAVKPFVPEDAPGWYVTASVIVYFWINWVILRQFEKNKWYVRV